MCTEGWHKSGGNVRLALREVGLNEVLTEGAEPTPLEMNVLCRMSVGRTETLQLLVSTIFVL